MQRACGQVMWKSVTWSKDCKKNMENYKRLERKLLEQCGQVAILVCTAWLQRCDECIEKNFVPSIRASSLDTQSWRQSVVARITRLAGAKTQLERTLVTGTRVANMRIVTKDLSSGERSTPRLKAVYWRDCGQRGLHRAAVFGRHKRNSARVRDATERHGNVKVNTAFNGKFATNNKH